MKSSFLSYILKWRVPVELWVILGGAAVLRLVGITNIFPSNDELASIMRAVQMRGGDLNPHWFGYPTGYYYFLLGLWPLQFLAGVWESGWTHPRDLFFAYLQDPMVVAPLFRVAGVLASILAIFFTYLAAEKIAGRRWAWLAGLFLAVSPFASYWSTQIWPEALIILPGAICLFFGIRYTETGSLKHILISGLAAGAAVSVKYNAVYLCAIIPCAVWAHTRLHGTETRLAWGHIFLPALASLVGFFVFTPFAVLDWRAFLSTFVDIFKSRSEISHIGLDAGWELQRTAPWIWWSQALNSISPGFLWLLGFALILVLMRWQIQYLVLIGTIIIMLPFLSWFGRAEFRHVIPILPIFGCTLSIAARTADSFAGRYKPLIFFVACVICLPGLQNTLIRLNDQRLPDTRIEARHWIEANVPDGSKILLDVMYVPHLVRSKEQVEYILNHPGSGDIPSSRELAMPRKISFWVENLPISIDSREHGLTADGRVRQPDLLTPAEYFAAGFEYVVLSAGTYERFSYDPRYEQLKEYYLSFFTQAEIIYEINSDGRPGPKITILRLNPSTP